MIDHVSGRWARPIAETFPTASLVAAVALDGGNFTDLVRLQVDVNGRRVFLVGRSSRSPEADEFVHRAGTVMTALTDTPLPTPTVHWMGTLSDGRAGTLLGYIAGDAVGDSAAQARITAAALATVHSVPTAGMPRLSDFPVLPSEHLRSWITPHPLATAALQVVADTAWTARSSPRVLVHGDFWTGNLVWGEGRVVGILDWDNASLSSPGVDVGKARLDLALKHGASAADELLDEYTRIAGAPEDQVFWDLRMALDGMPDPGRWWIPTYHRLGLTDLEPDKARVHFEEYLRRCLERLAALGSS